MSIPIPEYIRIIGIEETINAFLVHKDVRPGMMLQPPDYQERTEKDPQTKAKIKGIRAKFPDLLPSLTFEHSIIFTKRKLAPSDFDTDEKLGAILGYPCAGEFEAATLIKDTAPTTSFRLIAKLKDNVDDEQKEYHLVTNVCLNDAKRPVFDAMARAAEEAIRTNADLSEIVDTILVRQEVSIPPSVLMQKLVHAEPFTEAEMNEFREIVLANIGFHEDGLLRYPFDFTNPIHRGVGMALISLFLHDPLEPFFPLQLFPGKDTKIDAQVMALEQELRNALDSAKVVLEGGRRRRAANTRRKKKN